MTVSNLYLWRLDLGLTQAQAAQFIGISKPTYALYETLRWTPGPRHCELLQSVFGSRWRWLLSPADLSAYRIPTTETVVLEVTDAGNLAA